MQTQSLSSHEELSTLTKASSAVLLL